MRRLGSSTVSLLGLLVVVAPSSALEPNEIVVLVNRRSVSSREVADHYLAKRNIPRENVVELTLPLTETITRRDYDRLLAGPLRDALGERKDRVKCLLATYGVPLRVEGKEPSADEQAKLAAIAEQLTVAKAANNAAEVRKLLEAELVLSHKESTAAVDSELMLLWQNTYPLARWQINPLHWQFPAERRKLLPPMLMTARLDGPTVAIAKRLVDDAIAVEAVGLTGKVYLDARGMPFDVAKDQLTGYSAYDTSMVELTKYFPDAVLDTKNELFADGSCPDAMLYCGWYSHGKYRPSCTFVRGAVAWHLASSEAVSLRDPKATYWCPNLLKAGVAATVGPVAEPYTLGFPKPAEFFGFLATGQFTLAEVFARTTTVTSWMMVVVGDPLYNPFRTKPLVKLDDVKPSPAGVSAFRVTK